MSLSRKTTQFNLDAALASIREFIDKANRNADVIAKEDEHSDEGWVYANEIEQYLKTGFIQLKIIAEALGLDQLRGDIDFEYRELLKQKDGIGAFTMNPYGDAEVFASDTLYYYYKSIECAYGSKHIHVVNKEISDILQATQYAITDSRCFKTAPASEFDVHIRVESVLKCVFPDLRHKPSISKPIKNFEPDTGLPSNRTLIEYKFIQSQSDAKDVADEILADTRGYCSPEWDSFVFLIYETSRIKAAREWNYLLRECGTADNTQAIVICGEPGRTANRIEKQKRKKAVKFRRARP